MLRGTFILLLTFLVMLAGCTAHPVDETTLKAKGHYWQRAETSSALYTRGPKVQQLLNRDIARCVTELKELDRLGALRAAVPAESPEDDPDGLASWDTPERDGMLRAEHLPYADFEGCMTTKGWERVEYLPYDDARKARENYGRVILGEELYLQRKEGKDGTSKKKGDWDNLNE